MNPTAHGDFVWLLEAGGVRWAIVKEDEFVLGIHGVHLFSRQHKLEEALLFSGQFMDALQALVDWLYKVEPQLAEDQPVHGDLDLVMNLMDAHKVGICPPCWGWELCSSSPRAQGLIPHHSAPWH